MCNSLIDNYDLFIFDLDDTLIKTENYHYVAWLTVLKEVKNDNFNIDFNTFCSKFHSNKENNIKTYLLDELNITNYDKIIEKKNRLYLEIIKKESEKIELLEGAFDFLNKIINNNKKFVIVSNSLKNNVDFFTSVFPILQKSSKNYYRELFTNKKPNPECYLKVVDDFPNHKMIGFEDSITGIHAMTLVNSIDTIFINNKNYYYYNFIITNYNINKTIINYVNL